MRADPSTPANRPDPSSMGPGVPWFSDARVTLWYAVAVIAPAVALLVVAAVYLTWPEPALAAVVAGLALLWIAFTVRFFFGRLPERRPAG
jgi:hypothetical protein